MNQSRAMMSENTMNPIELVATNQVLQDEVNRLKRKLSETESELKKAKVELSQYQQYLTHDYYLARRIRRRTMMDRIPDLVLKALFRQMTTADKMVARKVCSRWSVLVPEAARSVRFLALVVGDEFEGDRQSMESAECGLNYLSYGGHWRYLKLLQKEDGSPLYRIRPFSKWNSLQLNSLDEDAVSQIIATFAGIKELQVHIWGGPPFQGDNLAHLLEQWPHQLVTLKLSSISTEDSADRLMAAINRLSVLKHLSIDIYFEDMPLLDERLISQLDELNGYTDLYELMTLLAKQDPAKLGQVRFNYEGNPMKWLVSLPEHLRQRFMRFDSSWISDYRAVCTAFRSLSILDVKLADTTLRDFFRAASQLTQLVSLGLDVCFAKINPDDQPDLLPLQLQSVKSLKLKSVTASHRDLEQFQLQWTMPNVQVISITFEYHSFGRFLRGDTLCTECAFTRDNLDVAHLANCMRQFFGPLKQRCSKLRTILFSSEDLKVKQEELLLE